MARTAPRGSQSAGMHTELLSVIVCTEYFACQAIFLTLYVIFLMFFED
jgi:hypothetical protein